MIFSSKTSEDSNWGPIADLMSGLMVVFLFIAVVYMLNVKEEKDRIEEIAITYNRLQTELYNDLLSEFEDDLGRWGAEIDEQLSIRFQEPDILFGVGSSNIRPRFREILNDFFPRYINILYSEKYVGDIEEIRIEGHTSSEWQHQTSEVQAYFNNMELSQNRTRAVLEHVLTNIEFSQNKKNWIKSMTTANGLSSSRPILKKDEEDKSLSRRVEFRVRTNAEAQMIKILSAGRQP
ncbi:MAG: OmpA family protein [Chitinispirillales bacterium]|jgi:outer membrane protein OmpA-like peptidoglycan-associated protein|nr:OmpA family protein [Chitinispirillales bacterium]